MATDELALRGFQSGLAGIHLRRRRQILALRVIHFLLRHDAGLALEDAIQARVLQVQRVVLRLIALQFVLRPADLVRRIFDFRLIFLQLSLQFWNLQNGHDLTGFHMRSVVDK